MTKPAPGTPPGALHGACIDPACRAYWDGQIAAITAQREHDAPVWAELERLAQKTVDLSKRIDGKSASAGLGARSSEREGMEPKSAPVAVAAQRTEPARCDPTCGTEQRGPGDGAEVWFCSRACRDAGKPLHPAKPPTCGTCGGAATIKWRNLGGELLDRPCPDCRPTPGEPSGTKGGEVG
jgi:hypothetical protein